MIHLAVLLFAFAGFTAICVSMAKHQPETLGRKLSPRDQLGVRAGGWAALTGAYLCAVAARGWRFGSVEWCFAIIVAALLLVALILPYRPKLAPRAGLGAVFAGSACAVIAGVIAVL